MKKINIMMLGGARRVSMAELFKRSGERIGREVNIISYELLEQVPIALVGKVVVGLRWSDPNVVADIVKVAKEYEIDIILPFVDGAIEIASKVRQHLPGVFVPVGDFEVNRTMFDKVEAAKAFEKAGLPIPRTYSAINAKMPAIAKPRKGSASRGIKIFHTLDELMQLEGLSDYLVQEYIENRDEYTVDCYVSQAGEILTVVPRVRLEVMGGEVTRTITCRNQTLDRLSRQVIETFSLRGPVTLQFLHDLDRNRYLLMEVNPRLGGGVVCSIYAGAPITDYIIDESRGITLKACDDWAYNTLMARYQKEAIFYES
ncbi:MAG: ATP-grasp domain-containing protein [Muribaculaceae bacterium]|nr:ATP-grasp domain-containing protein [Bacteroides sp.]MDE6056429.1 ATP-grasp domain-containing protein [Muribaculaceae bacterium]MDE6856937.1 ATP-grasp domain-containing protein [Muribaculaceae bacterium]